MAGLLLVDKPRGCTSHDVVGRVRYLLRTKKVGHAGTLDPMATGLLVLGVGYCTRLLGHLTLATKRYLATVRFGQTTSTEDADGAVLAEQDASALREPEVDAALARLTGQIQQVPSAVSAIKVDGQRSYQRHRNGEQVDLPPRPVTIFELVRTAPLRGGQITEVDLDVTCSSGTYVRALARDLGEDLGVGAHLSSLRRVCSGVLSVTDSVDVFGPDGPRRPDRDSPRPPFPDQLAHMVAGHLMDPVEAVRLLFPVRELTQAETRAIRFGQALAPGELPGVYAALSAGGQQLMALLHDEQGKARPIAVFEAAG